MAPGGGVLLAEGVPTSGGAHHWRKEAAYLVGRLQGAADVGKTLDAPVFAELGVDFGEGPFLDGVGEGQVRDVPEEGFVEREALGELEIAVRGGAGGRAGGSGGKALTRNAVGGDLMERHSGGFSSSWAGGVE